MKTLAPVQENISISIETLKAHARNYKQHPPLQLESLKESLKHFGQVRSIVVQDHEDGTYTIIAGHGVVLAAQALVNEDPEAHHRFRTLRADLIPASWSKKECEAYLVADNNIGLLATDDEELLFRLLQEQYEAGFNLKALGSDEETLRQMLAEGNTEPLDEDEEEERDFQPREELVKQPDELLDTFLYGSIRQIVLHFSPEEYSGMLANFRAIRAFLIEQEKLETNTELVVYLTNYYLQHEEVPTVEAPLEEEAV